MINQYLNNFGIVNQNKKSYWCGRDFALKLGEVWLDEGTQLTYQIQERVQPYYHYSKYVADRIIHGTRLITGELTMNFTQFEYVYALMNRNLDIYGNQQSQTSFVGPKVPLSNPLIQPSAAVSGASVGQLKNYIKTYNQDTSNNNPPDSNIYIDPTTYIFAQEKYNLELYFGVNLDNSSVLEIDSVGNWATRNTPFNPHPATGQKNNNNQTSGGNYSIGTALRIIDINVMGHSSTIDDSGRNIMETLQFMAKDIQIIKTTS